MRMMGLSDYAYYVSNFLYLALQSIIIIFPMVVLALKEGTFSHEKLAWLTVGTLSFVLSTGALSMTISTFFSNPTSAAFMAMFLQILQPALALVPATSLPWLASRLLLIF